MFPLNGREPNLDSLLEVCLVLNHEEETPPQQVVTKIQMREPHLTKMIKKMYTNLCRTKPHLKNKDWVSRTVQRKLTVATFMGKTNFDDSDAEDSSNLDSPVQKKRDENSEIEMGVESKEKIKKLCRHFLRQVPNESLKLKQLKKLIDEHSPSIFSNISSEEVLTNLKHKLNNSDRFSIKGKRVFLSKRN